MTETISCIRDNDVLVGWKIYKERVIRDKSDKEEQAKFEENDELNEEEKMFLKQWEENNLINNPSSYPRQ